MMYKIMSPACDTMLGDTHTACQYYINTCLIYLYYNVEEGRAESAHPNEGCGIRLCERTIINARRWHSECGLFCRWVRFITYNDYICVPVGRTCSFLGRYDGALCTLFSFFYSSIQYPALDTNGYVSHLFLYYIIVGLRGAGVYPLWL